MLAGITALTVGVALNRAAFHYHPSVLHSRCCAWRLEPDTRLPLLPHAEAGRAEAEALRAALAGLQVPPIELRAAEPREAALSTGYGAACGRQLS